jgi:NAD(P)-dependent dehydrogenase (short-subunit alcohol dehydrogenase family)
MTQPLAGRSVVVTGAGGGVGRGIARACAAAGAGVVVAARRAVSGDAVAREITALGGSAWSVECDVTRRADLEGAVQAAVLRFGGLDGMVHNATSARSPEPCDLESASAELWEEHCSVSLRGSYYAAQAALPQLRVRRGRFVLLTSPAGMEGSATLPLYAMVKAAQRAFVKSLAREWGRFGINVNALSPLAATPALVRAFAANPELEARLRALIPLGRIGDPEDDIGAATALMLGDGARYVTGQTWVVDGGRFTGL